MNFKTSSKVLSGAIAAAAFSFAGSVPAQTPPTIEVHAQRFAFVPAEITLKKGESVKLEIISDDVAHSLRIDELNVNLKAAAGEKVETIVTPEETGDFTGKCGVFCGVGHGKMLLTVHVVEGK